MPPSIIQKIIHPKASKEEEAAAAAEKNTEPSSSTETPLTEAPETTTGPSSSTPSKDPGPTTTTTTTTASTTAENMPPSSLPKTFKAAVFKEAGASLTLEDVEMKEPGEGEILIKVKACGVCHSDWNAQQGHFGSPYPLTPGHEVIGSIVAVGAGVKQWNTGDLVGGAWHGGHDGTCHQCQAGDFQLCSNAAINGVSRNGGYAEYCLLRAEAAVPIPTDADAAVYAPLLCAGVTVFNSIRHMGVSPGATVAIQGLGGLGHLGLQYASKMGYRTVALSSSDAKEKFAKDLGAHEYVDGSKGDQGEALQKLGGADLIVCTAPNPKIIPGLIAGLAPKGKLLVVAVAGEIPVDTTSLITKALSVHGWPSGHALDSEEAIRFADVHNVKCMIEKFPLEKAPEAFEHMLSGKARFRAVLVME